MRGRVRLEARLTRTSRFRQPAVGTVHGLWGLTLRSLLERVGLSGPTTCCSFAVGDHVFNAVGVSRYCEIKASVSVDPSLPQVCRFVIFLGAEATM